MVRLKEGQHLKVKLTVFLDPEDKKTLADIVADEIEAGMESNESFVARRTVHKLCEEYRKKKASGS